MLGDQEGRRVLTPRRQSGVSLIELSIALAIFGVLIALGAPSYRSWLQNAQIRTAADSIQNGLQLARIEALRRNTRVRFALTDSSAASVSDWQVCIYDPVTAGPLGLNCGTILHQHGGAEGTPNAQVGADVNIGSFATPFNPGDGVPGYVTFDQFGRVPTAPGGDLVRIDVRNTTIPASDERVLTLLINAGGQIRYCDPKLSAQTPANPQGC